MGNVVFFKSGIMKPNKLLFFSFTFLFINFFFSQNFSKDRDKFAKEWMKFALTESEKDFCKDQLTDFLEKSKLSDFKFNKLVDDCNLLVSNQFVINSDCFNFLASSVYQELNSFKPSFNSEWHEILFETLANNREKQIDFLNFSHYFFKSKKLFSEETFSWYFNSFAFSWETEKRITLRCIQGNLVCRVFLDGKIASDSIKIYQTDGVFDIFNNKWEGKGGEITWEKVKINKDETFAKLRNYKCNLTSQSVLIDTVELTTPYFNVPILGRLKDKTISELSEGESSPQFSSYEKRLKIKDLREGIDYDGEFTLLGDEFIGSGSNEKPAKLILKYNNQALFEVLSTNFKMNQNEIIIRKARIKMNYSNGDSLTIDDAFFYFDESKREISLSAPTKANIYSPFIDSYFKLYVYAPKLIWNLDTPTPYYTYEVATSQEQKVASIQSINYFDAKLFDKFKGVSGIHPFSIISKKCREIQSLTFTEASFASLLRKSIEQVLPEIVDMAADGFLRYDSNLKLIFVSQKLIDFSDASIGKIDFDNILISSDFRIINSDESKLSEMNDKTKSTILTEISATNLRKQNSFIYASINLDENYLRINEVNQVVLSKAQKTIIYPDSSFIIMEKNRDIRFSGWLNAGKLEFHTIESKFIYEDFKVKIINSDEAFLRVKPLRKEDGEDNIQMLSSISNLQGDLFIDDPLFKSGKQTSNSKFPYLQTSTDCFVFYDAKYIEKGAYDRERFYYRIGLFEMDSLDNFNEKSFNLSGELVSGGIFPNLSEKLGIMNDYSFGFIADTPTEGYDFYGTKTKYTNKIALSSNGLQGSGTIKFFNSTSISKKLTFLPDSTIGLAQFVNEESTLFPNIESELARITYQPKKQILQVNSYLSYPLSMFHGEVNMQGLLKLEEKSVTGIGTILFEDAVMTSLDFSFKQNDILSNNTSFSLINRLTNNDEFTYAFESKSFSASISLINRIGEFNSNITNRIKFPVNKFYCQMDKFKWYMNDENIELSNVNDVFENINSESVVNNFFSLDEKQDSLQFNSISAKFYLNQQTILCDKVKFVRVADALLYPEKTTLNIRAYGVIDSLYNSTIVANYNTKFHKFINASIYIKSRNFYQGYATYPYYDRDSSLTLVSMSKISGENLITVANGEIPEKSQFKLSKEFDYFGKIAILSSNEGIILNGSARLKHNCDYDKSWLQFQDTVIAKNIQLPISEQPINSIGQKMAIGFLWHDNENIDSLSIYPAFISKKLGTDDIKLFSISGYIEYNQLANEFQIATKSRLAKSDSLSNLFSLNIKTCQVNAYGDIDLGINLGDLKIESYGKIEFNQELKKTKFFLNAKITIPLPNSLMDNLANKIKLNDQLLNLDFNTYSWNMRNAFAKWSPKYYDKFFNDYQEDDIRKMPNLLENSLVLSGIVLESYGGISSSNKNTYKGIISSNNSVGIVGMNGISVFKVVPFQMFYNQTFSRSHNQGLSWKIVLDDQFNYFFNYNMEDKRNGEFLIHSSDETFKKIISDIKPTKRNEKNFKFDLMNDKIRDDSMTVFRSLFLYK